MMMFLANYKVLYKDRDFKNTYKCNSRNTVLKYFEY